jgi:NAD(P)-dependent dehydrogenase (short-subunit alcohol dehydrogenase family)
VTTKVWFITGCATGFGALLARTIYERGDALVATDRSRAALAYLGDPGERLELIELDVGDPQAAEVAASKAVDRFGRVDILVNNAGLGLGGPFEDCSAADMQRVMLVNALGPMFVTHPFLPIMRAQGGGRIINISSDSGVIGLPFQSIYCAAKHALEGFSESLSHEVAPFGIRITLVQPCGLFRTQMPVGAIEAALGRNKSTSPYHDLIAGMAHVMSGQIAQGSDPALVVEAIIGLAAMQNPPLRLPVGPPDRVGLVQMRQTMPDEQFVQTIRQGME